jgi:hypothetical protein
MTRVDAALRAVAALKRGGTVAVREARASTSTSMNLSARVLPEMQYPEVVAL